jgi:hypothetical protein
MDGQFHVQCHGSVATLFLGRDEWDIEGYDPDVEESARALGLGRSDCGILAKAMSEGRFSEPQTGINIALAKAAELGRDQLVSLIVNDIMDGMGWGWWAVPDAHYALDVAAENGHHLVVRTLFASGLPYEHGEAKEAIFYASERTQAKVMDEFVRWFRGVVPRDEWPGSLIRWERRNR